MMKQLAVTILAAFFLVACQSGQNSNDTSAAESEVETAAAEQEPQQVRRRYQRRERAQDTEPREAERIRRPSRSIMSDLTEGLLEQDGPGLTLMIDGSSPESFKDSLELIASETSQDQYKSLQNSLQMLIRYDPEVWGGEDALRSAVNGMSGEEIIERAQRIRSR